MVQRLLTRSKDGFTTCLVVRLKPYDTLTMANAGHIPPYVKARSTTAFHWVSRFGVSGHTVRLGRDDLARLLTDGVPVVRTESTPQTHGQ